MLQSGDSSAIYRLWRGILAIILAVWNQVISYLVPKTATVNSRRLHLVRLIAEGGYGYVWLAKDYLTSTNYALKQVLSQTAEQRDEVRKEIEVHKAFDHPHLMPLIDYSIQKRGDGKETANLLFPLMDGSIQDVINKAWESASKQPQSNNLNTPPVQPFSEQLSLQLVLGAGRGLQAMHSAGRAHRDVCPRNILLHNGRTPVVTDFGSVSAARVKILNRSQALALQEEATTKSSMPFRAPELWSCDPGQEITEAVDTWSLGCTLYACAFGYSPFECVRGEDGKLRLIDTTHVRVLGPLHFPAKHLLSKPFCDLIQRMCEKDPVKRIPLHDAIAIMDSMVRGAQLPPHLQSQLAGFTQTHTKINASSGAHDDDQSWANFGHAASAAADGANTNDTTTAAAAAQQRPAVTVIVR